MPWRTGAFVWFASDFVWSSLDWECDKALRCPPNTSLFIGSSSATAGEGRKEFKAGCGKINFKTQGAGKGEGDRRPEAGQPAAAAGGGSGAGGGVHAASLRCWNKQNAFYSRSCSVSPQLIPQGRQVT